MVNETTTDDAATTREAGKPAAGCQGSTGPGERAPTSGEIQPEYACREGLVPERGC
jgi:hypothetical protein